MASAYLLYANTVKGIVTIKLIFITQIIGEQFLNREKSKSTA